MTKSAAAISRREERIKQRQTQILDAARACVKDEGFHAATISRIGAVAGMSKGHIYKYYENKEEIMIALIEHDMTEFMLLISQLGQAEERGLESLISSFVRELPVILESDRTALWLEVQAEAARNPRVKEMAVKAANYFRETIRKIIEPVLVGPMKNELDIRVEMLLLSMHGLGLKATVHSDGSIDGFANSVEFVFRTFLSAPPQSVVAPRVKAA